MKKFICVFVGLLSVFAAISFGENNKVGQFKEIVGQNSMFWSRLGWPVDPPFANQKGTAGMVCETDAKTKNYVSLMSKAGIKIMTTNISSGWLGNDLYDYTEVDKALDGIFEAAPDAYYMPRVKLNVPPTWCAKNPEEAAVFYPGKLTNEEITELFNKGEFDVQGDSPNRKVGLQSFASKKWLADASEALRRFVEHIENSKYKDRIIGYHIAFGIAGECAHWRAWEKEKIKDLRGDYGKAFVRGFYDWGIAKYGSAENLAKVWNQPNISRENVVLPSPARREHDWRDVREFFRDAPDGAISADMEIFISDCTANALDVFGGVVKKASGGKAVGAFYGYYMNNPRAGYTGHLAYDKLLASKNIDFICAPKMYERNLAGDPGGYQNAAMSVSLKKLYIDELDNPPYTHTAGDMSNLSAKNLSQTRTVMWREVSKNLSINAGFWWMDLKGGWFTAPDVLGVVSSIEKDIAKLRADKSGKRFAQILYVTDEQSFNCIRPDAILHDDLFRQTYPEINLCGAPTEHYRLSDLDQIDLSKYKMIFFANTIALSSKKWRKLEKRIPDGTAIIWNYAAGVRPENTFDLENSKKITGMKMEVVENVPQTFAIKGKGMFEGYLDAKKDFGKRRPYPIFKIVPDGNTKILSEYADGIEGVALASKVVRGKTHYLSATPFLTADKFRKIAELAKVDFVAPENCTVYGDSRFVGIFPKYDVKFNLNLEGKYRDLLTGKVYSQGDEIAIAEKGAVVLVKE